MQIHVFDTHVKTTKGQYLHFDVLVDDQNAAKVDKYVGQYLSDKGIEANELTLSSCQFCHSEIANPDVQAAITEQGHFVLPLSGC